MSILSHIAVAWLPKKCIVVATTPEALDVLAVLSITMEVSEKHGASADTYCTAYGIWKAGSVGQFDIEDGGRSWQIYRYDAATRKIEELPIGSTFDDLLA